MSSTQFFSPASTNFNYFDIEHDKLELVEGLDVEGMSLYAVIKFDFSLAQGLTPTNLVFLNEKAQPISLAHLTYETQVWIYEQVKKAIDFHEQMYYNKIERYFLSKRG